MKKILILAIFLIFGCDKKENPVESNTAEVEYRVTGTAVMVDLTISNESEGTEQFSNARLPWSKNFVGTKGNFIYVSAQNTGSSGSVTAAIYINGSIFKTSTSNGAYVIATASGSIP